MESAYPALARIVEPRDLRSLSTDELQEVAREVRAAILDNVSKTGGHFSSNLGTVELTVALYATYEFPPDKIVWDTGHQAYPHKLLTGRLDRFPTLRKPGGLSGFLRREEHPLDLFGAGHAGTAISAALGFAKARDLHQGEEKVVAIAGDAAIATGMSWEALNHGGEMQTDMTVVLNDNRMSIAPNVGALTNYLARLRSRPELQDMARRAKDVVERMPEPITRVAAGLRHGITHYLAPEETGTIFEEMGWEYIGPVDGHDLPTLLDVFRNVRELRLPVFVHAITVKGKGYAVAEEDSRKWHGVVPFDLERNDMAKSAGPATFTNVFGAEMIELANEDPNVVAITAAMPDGTGLNDFARRHPERFFDTGIAEQHAVTFAAGLAAGGSKPFCAIYSTFLQRAYDQVLHDVALQQLPVRFCLDRAGLVGDDGPTHHGVFDLAYLNPIPNITVLAPRDTTELREMLRWMRDYDEGPTAIRYPRGGGVDDLPESRSPIRHGQAEWLTADPGATVALVAVGRMVGVAWQAAMQLRALNIPVMVLNARFVKPLDRAALLRAMTTGRILTLEEGVRAGGFGEAVAAFVREVSPAVRVDVLALPDRFTEHGKVDDLLAAAGLDADAVVARVRYAGSAEGSGVRSVN
jgi:1-deoxy-D-xylulose-5-phosphate synthase